MIFSEISPDAHKTHSDTCTPCTLVVCDYQKDPNTISPLLPQTAVCMYECCVVVGVWCAQLKVIIWCWIRDGKTGGQSSGHAAHPQLANQHHVPEVGKVQGTYDGTLRYSVTHRPHQNTALPNIPDPKKNSCVKPVVPQWNQREPLVLPFGKSNYLWTKWDILNHAKPNWYNTLYFYTKSAKLIVC